MLHQPKLLLMTLLDKITSFKSNYGAIENRIQTLISNLDTLKLNTLNEMSRTKNAVFVMGF